MLFNCTSVRQGLNYLSALPVRNNPVYTTWSINIGNFAPFCVTLKCIYVRNPLSFNLSPANYLIDSNLILTTPILLTFSLSNLLLLVSQSTISYSCPIITSYKLVLAMLVSPLDLDLEVVATINGVIMGAFGSMLFDFFYYNYGSNYIIKPCR